MTDLTPEQIGQYVDDEGFAADYEHHLGLALDPKTIYLDGVLSSAAKAILHAHARMLQQQATIERLTNLIEEHNEKCVDACRTTGRSECLSADAANSRCLRCPKDFMIDTQDGVK